MSSATYVRPGTARALSSASRPQSGKSAFPVPLSTSNRRFAEGKEDGFRSESRMRRNESQSDFIFEDNDSGDEWDEKKGEGKRADSRSRRASSRLGGSTATSYLASQLARPLVVTDPTDVSPSLATYARRDLLASASRRISSASGTQRITREGARVATSIVEWQAAARSEAVSLKRDPDSDLGAMLRGLDDNGDDEVGKILAPTLSSKGYSRPGSAFAGRTNMRASGILPRVSGEERGGERRIDASLLAYPRPLSGTPGDSRPSTAQPSRPSTASQSHANKVLARYGDGSLSGGGGDLVERFLFRRQVELIQSRNESEVTRALSEWREARNALDADIEMRIQARRRPNTASLLARLDYGGSVSQAILSGKEVDPIDPDGPTSELFDRKHDDTFRQTGVTTERKPILDPEDDTFLAPTTTKSLVGPTPARLKSPIVIRNTRPATSSGSYGRPSSAAASTTRRKRASLVDWWATDKGSSGYPPPTPSTLYEVPRPASKPIPGSLYVAGFKHPSVGSTAALTIGSHTTPGELAIVVQPTDVLEHVATIRYKMGTDVAEELERVRVCAEEQGIDMPMERVEQALRPLPQVPLSIQVAQLQAAGQLPTAVPPKPVSNTTAAPAKPAGKAAPGAKPAAKGAAAPATNEIKPFPGQGIGALTGATRPFSAGCGGGATHFSYPENPMKLAARLHAIRDEALGLNKKKPKASGEGKKKKK
jgi:hypothetical protein